MRYIELNPVRASMVFHPGEYRWSSYACNAIGEKNSLISQHVLYTELASSKSKRLFSYRDLFTNHLDKNEIHNIRETLNQELVLGRDDFKEKIEQMTSRQVKPAKIGRPRIAEDQGDYLIL